jgi:hypothetical protein
VYDNLGGAGPERVVNPGQFSFAARKVRHRPYVGMQNRLRAALIRCSGIGRCRNAPRLHACEQNVAQYLGRSEKRDQVGVRQCTQNAGRLALVHPQQHQTLVEVERIFGEDRLPLAPAERTGQVSTRQQRDDTPASGERIVHLGDEIGVPKIPILEYDPIICRLEDRRNRLRDRRVGA